MKVKKEVNWDDEIDKDEEEKPIKLK